MMKILFLAGTLFTLWFLFSCDKDPGVGGNNIILGNVYVINFDEFGNTLDTVPAIEQRVYILYGDNTVFDDEVRTQYDGQYKFNKLLKGSYTLFTHSECKCPQEQEPVFSGEVDIDKNGSVVTIPALYIANY